MGAKWTDEHYPSEEQFILLNENQRFLLRISIKAVNTEFKFPNATITNKFLDASFEIVANIISDPSRDLDACIKDAADTLNKPIELFCCVGN